MGVIEKVADDLYCLVIRDLDVHENNTQRMRRAKGLGKATQSNGRDRLPIEPPGKVNLIFTFDEGFLRAWRSNGRA